jgi:glycosyltransferase involved in cell wall biosynthesis
MVTLVSIIIPHFERTELLRATVNSVYAQTASNWEIIIVDDGSSTEAYNCIKALSSDKTQVIQRDDGPKGPSRCRNIGIQAAKGDYILFLDSDDLLAPNCIENRFKQTQLSPDEELWVFPVELFREIPGDMKQAWNNMEKGAFRDPLPRFLVSDSPWCVSSPLWRRRTLQSLRGFNEAVMYGDDADLHIRALLSDVRFVQFPHEQPDVYIRRADAPRITNTLSPNLLDSRLKRLEEGTRILRNKNVSHELMTLWEGQYFVEGEFLLFNQPDPRKALHRLVTIWQKSYPHSSRKIRLAHLYFQTASLCNSRLYILTRVMRRIMMRLLPIGWFPSQLVAND